VHGTRREAINCIPILSYFEAQDASNSGFASGEHYYYHHHHHHLGRLAMN